MYKEVRVVDYFDETVGFKKYRVEIKDRVCYAYMGNFFYGWRTMKDNMTKIEAEQYFKNYNNYVKEKQNEKGN